MSGIGDARQALADKVAAEGLRVSIDPREVNPPCVLIGPANMISRVTSCALEAVIPVFAVAPPPGNADATDWLETTIETLFGVLVEGTEAVPTVVTVGTAEAPAYELETRVNV